MGLETLLSIPLNRISQYHFAIDVRNVPCSHDCIVISLVLHQQAIFKLTPRNDPDYKNLTELLEQLGELQVRFPS